ncbi:MAG: hypothetical protein IPL38_06495 [Rhodobacter sp.]|jgi:hypothetical protein|nr:hypothetical protein [Rhodobacter sp.]MBK8439161.1 hypothetical protein [Rhodobacter sp.]
MRHDWVFDVLKDLLTYAQRNDLPALAARVQDALAVAEAEIAAGERPQAGAGSGGVSRPPRPH